MMLMMYSKERDQYDYPFHVKLKRFFTGLPDWCHYVFDEIRNADKDTSRFSPGELTRVPVSNNLKRTYSKAKGYAGRIGKGR